MPRIRVFSVLAVVSLLLSLLSFQAGASPAAAAAAAPRHAGASASAATGRHLRVSVHRTHLVPPVHPSLRVIRVRHVRVVRAHGIVRRARVVPWPRSRGSAAGLAGSSPSGTSANATIQLTAYAGGSGGGPAEYTVPTAGSQPEGVAVLGGNAWFAESSGDKIGEVTPAGLFTEYPVPPQQWGSDILHGITVGPDQNLWFTTYSYIGEMTPAGKFTFFPITPDSYAYDITQGPDGNLWFTEVLGKVGYVTPRGAVTEFAVGSGINPEYITAGPDGAVWFTATGSGGANFVYRITTGGSLTQYALPSTWILNDITTGPDGNLWFDSNTTALTALTPSGTYTTYTWPLTYPNGYSPQYIRQDGTGALVFANLNDGSIGRMTTSGAVSFTSVPSGNGATGLGVAADGTIWFSEVNGNAIGLLPPGPAQFPPAVPARQTYGCSCGTTSAARPEAYAGDPVNTATGAYSETVTDAKLPGPGVTFAFTRAYTSLDTTSGPLGPGWTDPYNASLSFDGSGNATFRSADGQQMTFTKNGDGSYTGAVGVYATLAAVSGGYQVVTPDQTLLNFNSSGQLTSMTDRSGTGVTLGYTGSQLTSVKDAGGRVVTLAYTSGLLTTLSMPDGRTVGYGYTGGLLTTVTGLRGGVTKYGYNSAGQLTTVTDPDTNLVLTNVYDPATGRVTSQTNGDNATTLFGWNAATQTATTTEPDGGVITDVYNSNVLLSQTSPLGGITYYSYDANLDLTQVTDPLGNRTTMTYDAAGNMLSKTDPAPLYYNQTWTYNSMNEVLTHKDGRGYTTTYAYTSAGLLTTVTDPDQNQASYTYYPDGQVETVTNPDQKTTTYTYDSADNLATVKDPAGNITSYGYDTDGRLTTVKDPLLHTTTYGYDKSDDLTSVKDRLNHTTSYGFDADGHRTSVTNALNKITKYAYDPAGHLTSVTDPLQHATVYTYDGDGNLATITDPDQNLTTNHYDLAGDLTSVTRPDQTTLSYTYNLDQQQTSFQNAAGNTTSYIYDPLGRVTAVIDPLGRGTDSTYDGDDNLVTVTSPDGLVTTNTYDPASRLTAISYSDGTTHGVSYLYYPAGERKSMTDATGTTGYTYDNDGRLSNVTNGANQAISYGYNADSSITTVTYPNGKTVTDGYDNAQRLTSVTDWNSKKTTFGYNNDNVLTSEAYPNGITATTAVNDASQITSITDTNSGGTLASFAYGRGNDGELNSTTTSGTAISAPAETYTYNPLSQLTGINTTTDGYDNAGDPTTLGPTTQTFNAAGQLSTSITGTAGTSYSYNPRGDRTSATGPAGTTTYGYNQTNQLTSYTPPAGTATSYTNNGDGLRAGKTTGTTTASYAWDINASIPLLLTDGTTSYLYGPDGLPIEQISSAGTPTYLLHDQIGSTRLLTSPTGTVTATYTYDAYGNITSHTGTATTPFLYAGQYQDTETGFYYLRNRYYDPATAQFLTTDPLVNQTQAPYYYASDNPLNGTDPTGLITPPGLWIPPSRFELGAACITGGGSTAENILFGLLLFGPILGPLGDGIIFGIGADAGAGALEVIGDGFSASEKAVAQWLADQGDNVILREATGIGRTSDLLVNGTPYDVYTPEAGTSIRNILSNAAGKWTQVNGGGVVIDLNDTGLSAADFGDALARVNGFIRAWGGTPISNVTFYGG